MLESSVALVIVMGVSGSGKTTLGRALEVGYDFKFVDADDYHSLASLEKMRAGIALDEADRLPWLSQLAGLLKDSARQQIPTVLACSALKAQYRTILSSGSNDILFVHLQGDQQLIASRLETRVAHFMPKSLLASQIAALEPPDDSDSTLTLDCDRPVGELSIAVIDCLKRRGIPIKAPLRG